MKVPRRLLLVGALIVGACSSEPVAEAVEQAVSTTTNAAESHDTATTATTTTTTGVAAGPEETTVTQSPPEPELRCVAVTNFDDAFANEQWVVVNDNVMGGRSLGDRSFTNSTMVFAGAINTNGGGFSSLRLPLEPGAMATADRVVFRARSDARTYLVTFDDDLERRDSRVSFRAAIPFERTGDWEVATVMLDDLYAAAFGQRVVTEPFQRDSASRMGLMVSDGIDGDFRLEVDSIEFCSQS